MKRNITRRYGNASPITICIVDIEPQKFAFEIMLFNGMKIIYNPTGLYIATPIATNKIEEAYVSEFLADAGISQKLNAIITEELSLCLRQIKNNTTSLFDFGL